MQRRSSALLMAEHYEHRPHCPDANSALAASFSLCPYCRSSAGLNTCTQCPTGSQSPAGSVGVNSCTCPSGQFMRNGACTPCGAGTSGSNGRVCTCASGYTAGSWTPESNACTLQCLAQDAPCPSALGAACCNGLQCINGQCGGRCPANQYLVQGGPRCYLVSPVDCLSGKPGPPSPTS